MMLTILSKVINDFTDELDVACQEKCSGLRFALEKSLSSLTLLEEAFLDGFVFGYFFIKELRDTLKEAENEFGFLLWAEQQEPTVHHRLTALLVRLSHYQAELDGLHVKQTQETFRLPLFSRSDSFRRIDYDIEERREKLEAQMSHVKRIAIRMQKQALTVSAKYTIPPSPPSKSRKSAKEPPKAPPPPPPPQNKDKFARQRSEITRLPKVIRLFHSFQSSTGDTSSLLPKSFSLTKSVSGSSTSSFPANPDAVIGELLSKSKHAQKINEEIEKYGNTITQWAKEIKSKSFNSMEEVHEFVQNMDQNINQHLTDETIILKKFDHWPLRYDIMREASGRWKQLKDLEVSLLNWNVDSGVHVDEQLKKMRDFVEKVNFKLQDLLRTQTIEESKYDKNGLPWPSEIFDRVKRASLALLEVYMKLVLQRFDASSLSTIQKRRNLLSNCACFAFKVHQLVGGFNQTCTDIFSEIETVAQQVINDLLDRPQTPPIRDRNCIIPQAPYNVANC